MEVLPVMPEPGFLFELLVLAHVALESVLVPVDVGMYLQVTRLREYHSADFTRVKLDRPSN